MSTTLEQYDGATARAEEILGRARRLAERVAPRVSEIEAGRTVPKDIAEDMRSSGLFRITVAREYGGEAANPSLLLSAIEEVAAVDASVAWGFTNASGGPWVLSFLSEEERKKIFASGPDVIVCGSFQPAGTADVAGDGAAVDGRWQFGSFAENADMICLSVRITENGEPVMLAPEVPLVRQVLVPRDQVTIIDTWHASGLRGSGSHDIRVDGARVDNSRIISLLGGKPVQEHPLYQIPMYVIFALSVASVAVGIGRGALADIRSLALSKRPTGGAARLADSAVFQRDLAYACGRLDAARTVLHFAAEKVWSISKEHGGLTLDERAQVRADALAATRLSADVVDFAYSAGGTSSLWDSNSLQRRFRDLHAITPHLTVNDTAALITGSVLAGVGVDTPLL